MLNNNEHGYAVMNKELTAYSLESTDIDTCKRYCRNDDVIARRIPYVCGFSIRLMWYKWWKPFYFRYGMNNILWLHWNTHKEYLHKTGEIVYYNPTTK